MNVIGFPSLLCLQMFDYLLSCYTPYNYFVHNKSVFYINSQLYEMLQLLGFYNTIHFLRSLFSHVWRTKVTILYMFCPFRNSVFRLVTNDPSPLSSFSPLRTTLLLSQSLALFSLPTCLNTYMIYGDLICKTSSINTLKNRVKIFMVFHPFPRLLSKVVFSVFYRLLIYFSTSCNK